ncbi:MAG TPA: VOC family protein [Longimicrobium sp.]|nr:VOC family protein [Longimicrobium sp.]
MHGSFVWNELAAADPAAARDFYAAALGWTFEPFDLPDGPYWVAKAGGRVVAGIGGLDTAAVPGTAASTWFAFVEVDDVDVRLAKAVELGATVVQPPVDVPMVGRVAVLRDPTGAPIGWMTAPPPEEG